LPGVAADGNPRLYSATPSGLGTQHSAHSALRTQHSGLGTQDSALRTQHSALRTQLSHVESKMNDVAVLNYVLFPFQLELALFATLCFASQRHQIFEPDNLCPDEPSLNIRVNSTRRLLSLRPALD